MVCPQLVAPNWSLPLPAQAPGAWLLLGVASVGICAPVLYRTRHVPAGRPRLLVRLIWSAASVCFVMGLAVILLIAPSWNDVLFHQYLQQYGTVTTQTCADALNTQIGDLKQAGDNTFQALAAGALAVFIVLAWIANRVRQRAFVRMARPTAPVA